MAASSAATQIDLFIRYLHCRHRYQIRWHSLQKISNLIARSIPIAFDVRGPHCAP